GTLLCFLAALAVRGEVKVAVEHNREATVPFSFKAIPAPLRNDLAANANFSIVDGESDPNGSNLRALNDGRLPEEAEQPSQNFFFKAGDDGGRLQLDLGGVLEIKQINSYSWHTTDRAPQVYKVYGAEGDGPDFNPTPKRDTSPDQSGWRLLVTVDTRP